MKTYAIIYENTLLIRRFHDMKEAEEWCKSYLSDIQDIIREIDVMDLVGKIRIK